MLKIVLKKQFFSPPLCISPSIKTMCEKYADIILMFILFNEVMK